MATPHLSLSSKSMYVESYWESWILDDYPQDYCAELKDVPASPIGSTNGVNYINIGKQFKPDSRISTFSLIFQLFNFSFC